MSNYPYSFDNNITLPGVSGSTQEDVAITALRSAVFAIETELGVTPSGIYPDVRTRLDILEARIQFGISPQIPNDGYVKSPLYIWNVPQSVILSITDGYGAPTENRLDGSLYMRGGDGYANNQLYVRLNGSWYPIQTEQFTAAKDLAPYTGISGNPNGHLAQTVIGLYNHPFNPTMNTVGSVQDGYHVTWNNLNSQWEAQTGFIPSRDLAAFSGPYGRTGQTVTGIQGFHVSPVAPQDGYMFVWNATNSAWEPRARPIVFTNSVVVGDGYVVRTNISSNKGATQSPNISAAGKVGMINFGSRSTGATTGVTESYGAILSGDRNSVSGLFGLVTGGDSHTASGQYSTVINGLTNTASGQYSLVGGGTTNTASQTQAVVLDGYSNTASAAQSFVLNGGSNAAGAIFSGILNGISNTITSGAAHSGIGWGQFNLISAGGISSVILGGSGNQVLAGQNSIIGTSTNARTSSNYAVALNGIGHTINSGSDHSVILSGNTHTISASSGFALIGAGNNLTATGLYATILNSTGGSVNGLHTLLLNGNSNSITGSYSTIVNGLTNTISGAGATAYATILDGYNNTVSAAGGFIADGYNNTISGQWSSIINGNFNTLSGRNSTILNGANNTTDSACAENVILIGTNNVLTGSNNTITIGNGNTYTNVASHFILGSSNNHQSTFSFTNGSGNISTAGTSFNRMFGSNNTFSNSSSNNITIGNGNNIGPTATASNIAIFGSNNIVDATSAAIVHGASNVAQANFVNAHGQFGKARMFGQEVRANSRFTQTTIAAGSNGVSLPTGTINVVSTTGFPANGTIAVISSLGLQTISYTGTTGTSFTGCTGGTGVLSTGNQVGKIGEAQWSRLIMTGSSTGGAAIPLQLQDTVATNPTFVDGYSYDLSIKVLIVNTSPITPNPVVPARYYIDVLAHQEGGVLVLDNINTSLSTPNTVDSVARTPWTVTVSTNGGNQMLVTVDIEAITSYVQPSNTPSNRRAIATIEMREISRI